MKTTGFIFPKTLDECKSLGFEDARTYLKKEAACETLDEKMELTKWVIETVYGPQTFDELKASNRKVSGLFSLITSASFSLSDETKNLLRSGTGAPTRTEEPTATPVAE